MAVLVQLFTIGLEPSLALRLSAQQEQREAPAAKKGSSLPPLPEPFLFEPQLEGRVRAGTNLAEVQSFSLPSGKMFSYTANSGSTGRGSEKKLFVAQLQI